MASEAIKRLHGELLLTHGRSHGSFRWEDVNALLDIAEAAQQAIHGIYHDSVDFRVQKLKAALAKLEAP